MLPSKRFETGLSGEPVSEHKVKTVSQLRPNLKLKTSFCMDMVYNIHYLHHFYVFVNMGPNKRHFELLKLSTFYYKIFCCC